MVWYIATQPPIPLRILAQRIPLGLHCPALIVQPVDSCHRIGKLGPEPPYLAPRASPLRAAEKRVPVVARRNHLTHP
jgi:hypothetical protein